MSRISERIENFKRAFDTLSDSVNEYRMNKNKVVFHMAVVQSFEICFELGWKILKDYLNNNGINASFPKQVIKEAFNKEAIQNGQIWIDMLQDRNSTSHEYNMDKVDKALEKISTIYFEELSRFKEQIKDFDE